MSIETNDIYTHPLTHKIGQLIMVGFEGQALEEEWPLPIQQQVQQGLIGGVILFSHNITTPQQTRTLTEALQRSTSSGKPLLIAVDQEGGKVERLTDKKGFIGTSSAIEIAKGSIDEAQEKYKEMAKQLANYGFNFNFGPVADLDIRKSDGEPVCSVIGALGRSFGTHPEIVVKFNKIFIDSHRAFGVLTSLKHYPGHGSATGDTHAGLVDITHTHLANELQPFQALIKSNYADSIMVAHLVDDKIDKGTPASLSHKWVQEKLRIQEGFEGVVVTDDLHMGAILQNYELEDLVIKAIQAGNDLLVFSNNKLAAQDVLDFKADPELPLKIIQIVQKAIKKGKISSQRIEESYQRIMKLKSKLADTPLPTV